MLQIQDFTPVNVDIFQLQNREDPARRAGEFERILQAEMKRAEEAEIAQSEGHGEMSDKELLEVCYEMESIFVGQMLKTMRKTVMETDFFGKSMAKDIFNDMLYDEYAKVMAKSDAFGLARQIYTQLRG
jgi:flagellar protein FlgJ